MPSDLDLTGLLHRTFGHREFRPHQQVVCEAAAGGRDVLLVMPTGAGKSLCYQLPALHRRAAALAAGGEAGTALVVSPLIALMDDQAAKLAQLGLRVARIHSGLGREAARQACREYLAGELDFLFIAPERMRVPGFPEMLAKRKPALVAIDEAHCISQWGHDFRPDYRTLGQHLPLLRPAPIVALTATATPAVRADILQQLRLERPEVFVTGFRRTNLAVEVVELSKPQRTEFALKLLREDGARPAIIYAGSRKQAEELASACHPHFPAAAYHAGLEPAVRDRVQRAFLDGKLDVVVATVAFGMGVDKADVRTVVHVALPGSVEGYYQEIGRAGRDGKPSRTVLLHGFADRKLQEFLLEKSYPPVGDLERVAAALPRTFIPVHDLHNLLVKAKQTIDRETLDRTLEKLLISGMATMDMNGDVRAAEEAGSSNNWQRGYEAQVAARRAQIDRMIAFAESNECRMRALVQHFGDTSDTARSCGLCDVCNPAGAGGSAGASAHQPDGDERRQLRTILRALESRGTSTGKLFTDLKLTRERQDFDALLEGLARAGLIAIANDTFRNPEGKDITYRKATITPEGRDPDDRALDTVWIRGSGHAGDRRVARKSKPRGAAASRPSADAARVETLSAADEARFDRLRAWRTEVARPTKTPAFMILSDATLRAIAQHAPANLAALHAVPGMGAAKVDRFGAGLLAALREDAPAAATTVEPVRKAARTEAVPPAAPRHASPSAGAPPQKPVGKPAKADPNQARAVPAQPPTRLPLRTSEPPQRAKPAALPAELHGAQKAMEEQLKEWRKAEAAKAGLPSFFVLSDTSLRSIVQAQPKNLGELRNVQGLGTDKVDKFGAAILQLCAG